MFLQFIIECFMKSVKFFYSYPFYSYYLPTILYLNTSFYYFFSFPDYFRDFWLYFEEVTILLNDLFILGIVFTTTLFTEN